MTRIALLVLVMLGVASPEPADVREVRRGPPLICYPIEIGLAASLPWGEGSVTADSRPAPAAVLAETLRILGASDSALVHMETLRRAYFCLNAGPRGGLNGDTPMSPDIGRLAGMLKDAVLVASVPGPNGASDTRREALAWFDLGYLLAIRQCGWHARDLLGGVSCHRILERAAGVGPRNVEIQIGVAFGQVMNGVDGDADPEHRATQYWHDCGWQHLSTAMGMGAEDDSLVAKNICRLFADDGYYGTPTNFAALRKRIAGFTRHR